MPLLSLGRTLLTGFTQLIYPNTCWTCGVLMPSEQRHLCETCDRQLTIDPFPTCPRCSSTVGPNLVLHDGCPACIKETFAFTGVIRMAPYDGLLRDVILRMKQPTGEDLAEVIGAIWAKKLAGRLAPIAPDLVLPVPLYWTRRWTRGFNQSEILAQCLAKEMAIPVLPRALRRLRETPRQAALHSPTARRENVRNAFDLRSTVNLAGKSVLLVDDVLTSGATAHEAARALLPGKPKAVFVVVLAHGR